MNIFMGASFQNKAMSLCLLVCKGVVAVGLGLRFPNLEGGNGSRSFDYIFASIASKH